MQIPVAAQHRAAEHSSDMGVRQRAQSLNRLLLGRQVAAGPTCFQPAAPASISADCITLLEGVPVWVHVYMSAPTTAHQGMSLALSTSLHGYMHDDRTHYA